MKADSLSFSESSRVLAERAGIPIAESVTRPEHAPDSSAREMLLKIHEQASAYYHELLLHSPDAQLAREYLAERGVARETITSFKLGYCLPQWDGLLKYLQRKGWQADQIREAGLAISRDDGRGFYDRFRDRLIFPIRNLQGKVIAFGGRMLPPSGAQSAKSASPEKALPKYLNSPETPLYVKGQCLYALDQACRAASREGNLVIVEGYLDALAAHQAGFRNVAATLGTALTPDHVHLIRRFSRKVILIFDPDQAGIRAALRTVELFLGSGVGVHVAALPEGQDPDSFLHSRGAAAFEAVLRSAVGLLDFAVHQIVAKASKESIEDKLKIVEEILPVLAKIPNHVERAHYLRRVADELRVHERDLGQELSRHIKRTRKSQTDQVLPPARPPQFPPEEEMLIRILLQGHIPPDGLRESLQPEEFTDHQLRHIYELIMASSRDPGAIQVQHLLEAAQDQPEVSRIISAWSLQEIACDDYEKTIQDCLQTVRIKRFNQALREMEERIRRAELESDPQAIRGLQEAVISLKKQIILAQQGPGVVILRR